MLQRLGAVFTASLINFHLFRREVLEFLTNKEHYNKKIGQFGVVSFLHSVLDSFLNYIFVSISNVMISSSEHYKHCSEHF